MNSRVESMPRVSRMWLRTAASTSTARLRPGRHRERDGGDLHAQDRPACPSAWRGGRAARTPSAGISRCTMSRSALRGRTAVSPKIERMLSTPRPAHLEEVAQHRRAAPLHRLRADLLQLDHVVGHQAVAARDELERELALADRGVARDEHADLEHVEEHAVQRRDLAQLLLHVGAQHVDHVLAGLGRGEQRRARARRRRRTSAAGAATPSHTITHTVSPAQMRAAVSAAHRAARAAAR